MASVRLKNNEMSVIVNAFINTFRHGELYLFGSRTDMSKRGGDIDLYIVPALHEELSRKKIEFLVDVKKRLGERKIDVVIDWNQNREIDKIAKTNGVLLCRS